LFHAAENADSVERNDVYQEVEQILISSRLTKQLELTMKPGKYIHSELSVAQEFCRLCYLTSIIAKQFMHDTDHNHMFPRTPGGLWRIVINFFLQPPTDSETVVVFVTERTHQRYF